MHALDALHAAPPHNDVEDDEDQGENADGEGDNGILIVATLAEGVADHKEGIVGAVEQHGIEEGLEEVGALVEGVELGQRDIVAHGDGEEEMGRHGQYAAHEGYHDGVVVAGDIHDILDTGEAQGDEDGIDNAVEELVEMAAAPDDHHQQHQLAELLAASCHGIAGVDAVHNGIVGREEHEHRLHDGGR